MYLVLNVTEGPRSSCICVFLLKGPIFARSVIHLNSFVITPIQIQIQYFILYFFFIFQGFKSYIHILKIVRCLAQILIIYDIIVNINYF